MEAIASVIALLRPRTVIVDDETYFETRHYLQYLGTARMVQLTNLNDLAALEAALWTAEKPCLICGDSPSTFGKWIDVPTISALARQYGAFLMVDNSHVSLFYENPIAKGADICVESYTKYVCGHGDAFAGGLALSDSMRWMDDMPVPVQIPGIASIDWVLSRRGIVMHPRSAYMVARGLETLPMRMERHTKSASLIYSTLRAAGVSALYSGCGGLITLPGQTEDFCKRLRRFATMGTFGCTYSNADFFRSDAAYRAGFCARLSIGLEEPDGLMQDIAQALDMPLMPIYETMKGDSR